MGQKRPAVEEVDAAYTPGMKKTKYFLDRFNETD
jgi:hypothetical protein